MDAGLRLATEGAAGSQFDSSASTEPRIVAFVRHPLGRHVYTGTDGRRPAVGGRRKLSTL